ncbi:phosphotransferase [Archangium violaceum]|uniref:aminoglycoside phosphotransferase family protein n=1 Tax=Archangium violaceum TaxID=83451 RepID=UPI00193BE343|nr:aminoglycoside phosphotransferase family protein [Archangium violaceum]QRK10100.1 phosphotransferase [Archangium violaceum]
MAEGPAGEAWLAGLGPVVEELADRWSLAVGRTLTGGTEALVVDVTMADGRQAVLKVNLPARDPSASQLRTLLAARGRGYAEVYAYDPSRGTMLMERLGPSLNDLGLPVDLQLELLCETLTEAWALVPEGACFMTGAEKARSLSDFIETSWRELGRPCPVELIDTALRYAESRRRAFEPTQAVLAHGDSHPWNALQVPGGGSRRFKFVDPDGLIIERAYDLGILMREWTSELLAGDPLALGTRRCRRLAELTGVDAEAIWQWGFIERTSTGLLCARFGWEEAREMLAVAEAWAMGMAE